ncbi:hypothetical protein SPRG_17228 [Saprolegnia parasitica CBS 223.65]|uniref:ABC-2 type transporter transmembrane domain-containing protein n=1 Tax=Saprolegnia parasitica (strain CBS 223.65) TaxID=695850 RepID=A0A067BGS4_SAPPC|nr:hypothetical protein SPRG_17228 [Saprolegnia parasitica CBS 223.65]KDO17348.1 hypothetical protein SPRG_17228 [Saprolegnia parasitica CBS 223.65]|eukprot:XP_012211945.1 hypothetical protein SPRG_17228 [Saprolegnia parasitica CBS 223.65]
MVVVMSLLYSSNYYHVAPDEVVTVLGVIFVAVLFLALAREIFYKQERAQFFRTSSFLVAHALTQLPLCLLETLVFGSVMYWVTGFVSDVGAFVVYLLLLFWSTWPSRRGSSSSASCRPT